MKALLLTLLVGCTSDVPPCEIEVRSDVLREPVWIASGPELVGVAYNARPRNSSGQAEFRSLIVSRDGTRTADVGMPVSGSLRGATGTTTAAWTKKCGSLQPFVVHLQRGETFTTFPIADRGFGNIAFDGTRYQLFYLTYEGMLYHRTLDEDGTLGEAHLLGQEPAEWERCVDVTSDGAGTTFLRVEERGFIFEPETTSLRVVYDSLHVELWPAFAFAGEFHLARPQDRDNTLMSFPPTTMGTYRTRVLDAFRATSFHATPSRLYGQTREGYVELDSALAVVNRREDLVWKDTQIGTLGDDVVRFEMFPPDVMAGTPARFDLVRDGTEPFRMPIAQDSPLREVEVCRSLLQ